MNQNIISYSKNEKVWILALVTEFREEKSSSDLRFRILKVESKFHEKKQTNSILTLISDSKILRKKVRIRMITLEI